MEATNAFVREAAWNYILEQRINFLPVDVFDLARRNGYGVYTYLEFAKIIKKPISYIVKIYGRDGMVFWSNADKRYVICYNADHPSGTIRWTIMHEIGHIVLKHITPQTPVLSRVKRTDAIEREADGFARRVLCPSVVLYHCRAFSIPDIVKLCGISEVAAYYRSRHMEAMEADKGNFFHDPLEMEVFNQFRPFMMRYSASKAIL